MGMGFKHVSAPSLLASLIVLTASAAFGMGGSKPQKPSYALPDPMRHVIVRPFQNVNAFETPNQVTTNMDQAQAALGNILTEVATQAGLSVIQGGSITTLDPCGKHLEIWPAVTEFTLDAMSASIVFGFNSTGAINLNQVQATGQDAVQVGNVHFEFSLFECDNASNGSCTSLVASDADQSVVGNNFQFTVNWQQLSAGGDIITKTDLATVVRSIMTSGVQKLVTNPSMAQVPWSTQIVAVNSDGTVTMLAGTDQNIASNQYFTVYANNSTATSACGVYEALACIVTGEVDGPSSIGRIYQTLQAGQSRKIQVGDVVEVGSPACAPAVAAISSRSLRL